MEFSSHFLVENTKFPRDDISYESLISDPCIERDQNGHLSEAGACSQIPLRVLRSISFSLRILKNGPSSPIVFCIN